MEGEGIIEEVSQAFLLPGSSERLRFEQAQALVEAQNSRGLLANIGCGIGKTLVTLLLSEVMGAKRPLLILPSALINKTRQEVTEYEAKGWRVTLPDLVSYQDLGRASGAHLLEQKDPDFIMADECHFLKDPKTAVTRRVLRFLEDREDIPFCGLSGTLVRSSLGDYAHLLILALRDRAPVPLDPDHLRAWIEALDGPKANRGGFLARRPVAELARMGIPTREQFRARLLSCPGVVISEGISDCAASLRVTALETPEDPDIADAFKTLRTRWEAPDGWWLSDPVQVWGLARQLALGFYYAMEPRPAESWYETRRNWGRYVRGILARSEIYDSEGQVQTAVEEGALRGGADILRSWLEAKAAYKGSQETRWVSRTVLEQCQKWMQESPGVVWTEHAEFGQELARKAGCAYYGEGGCAVDGSSFESETGRSSVVASRLANSTGRNLQMFSRNLVVTPLSGGLDWEQNLARTHRSGQKADTVTCDVLLGCIEHIKAMNDARLSTTGAFEREGLRWRLGYCDLDYPKELEGRKGWRWGQPEIGTEPAWKQLLGEFPKEKG